MILIKTTSFTICCLVVTFLAFSAAATQQSPYVILENTTKSLFNKMASLSKEQRQDHEMMRSIVEQELFPVLDYEYASFKILGSNIKHSTKEQRVQFVEVMRENLLQTYTTALSAYENQQVLFEPAGKLTNARIVTVRAKIVDTVAPAINLHFKLRQNKQSMEWKIFDLTVEGISLLTSKRSEVSSQIRKVGLDGLIDILKEKNKARQPI